MKNRIFQLSLYFSLIFTQNFNAQFIGDIDGSIILSLNPSLDIVSFNIEHDGCIQSINHDNYPLMQYWASLYNSSSINSYAQNINGVFYPIIEGNYTSVLSLFGDDIHQDCISQISGITSNNDIIIAEWCNDFDQDQICDDLETSIIQINSDTHPIENLWYNNNDTLNFEISSDLALGYYYKFTTDPNYELTLNDMFSNSGLGTFYNVVDTVYYFHVIPMDYNYNFLTSRYKRFQYNIMQRSIGINSLTHEDSNVWYDNPNPFFVFESKPGIDNYYWIIDQNPETIPDPLTDSHLSISHLMVSGLSVGSYYLHLIAVDNLGNLSEASHFQFNIYSQNLTYGCTDVDACNYDPSSNIDNGTCLYQIDCFGNCGGSFTFDLCGVCNGDNSTCSGCTDDGYQDWSPNQGIPACNYDPNAIINDSSCTYEEDCLGIVCGQTVIDDCGECNGSNLSCGGCTDLDAINYDSEALFDDGSCEILGCIDICANNYNSMANIDDGSCDYASPDLNGDGSINILDTIRMIEIILNN